MAKNLFKKSDRLFKESKKFDKTALIKSSSDKFYLMSEGYKEASLRLSDFIEDSGFWNDILIYPLIYLHRHFIEIRLKELIRGAAFIKGSDIKIETKHSLMKFWKQYRQLAFSIDVHLNPEEFNNVERIIYEINQIDPKSIAFRYPVGKDNQELLIMESIDIENFVFIMKKIIDFFNYQVEMISNYVQLTGQMMSDLYDQYY